LAVITACEVNGKDVCRIIENAFFATTYFFGLFNHQFQRYISFSEFLIVT